MVALRLFLALTLVTGLLYPLLATGLAHLLFSWKAEGSLLRRGGEVVGSALLGQAFSSPRYFHPRPSATGGFPYNPMASGASNLAPGNPEFAQAVAARARAYRAENGLPEGFPVPMDAVTASASGLEPYISPENARLQARRVAQARGLSEEAVLDLVRRHLEGRQFGLLGEPRVHVVLLNLELDRLQGEGP
ncbi:potassium-transporting ATPase subunit KdpC [Thermus sp. FJN-A]